MKSQPIMINSNFPALGEPRRGKVRDIYDLGASGLLFVVTDRISAFDAILPNGIPGKGEVLNTLSALWLRALADIIPNHLATTNVNHYPPVCQPYTDQLRDRSMLVWKAEPLPIEAIVRGYLSGSGWKSYQQNCTVCGIQLPTGLVESQELPTPIFTPSTKAESGHDENISFARMTELVGAETAAKVRDASLALYSRARELALKAGIIIADTKLEFGLFESKVILIDEVLTPDSSRFWPADQYRPGGPQPSFDKQYVRDYLEHLGWNKLPPAPELPAEVVEKTAEKYREALTLLAPVLQN